VLLFNQHRQLPALISLIVRIKRKGEDMLLVIEPKPTGLEYLVIDYRGFTHIYRGTERAQRASQPGGGA
jgi:hypothetical protein